MISWNLSGVIVVSIFAYAVPIVLRRMATAVKGRCQAGSGCNYKAAVALQCPVRNRSERSREHDRVVPCLYRELLAREPAGGRLGQTPRRQRRRYRHARSPPPSRPTKRRPRLASHALTFFKILDFASAVRFWQL